MFAREKLVWLPGPGYVSALRYRYKAVSRSALNQFGSITLFTGVFLGKKDMYTAFNTQTEGVKYLVLINCGATIGIHNSFLKYVIAS
jgi:hypothetical protein